MQPRTHTVLRQGWEEAAGCMRAHACVRACERDCRRTCGISHLPCRLAAAMAATAALLQTCAWNWKALCVRLCVLLRLRNSMELKACVYAYAHLRTQTH